MDILLGKWLRKLRLTLGVEFALAYGLLFPLAVVLIGLLAYPIASAIGITLQDKKIGLPGKFIGLQNYYELLIDDPVFWLVVQNSVIFTVCSVTLKATFGMVMALVLNRPIAFRGFFRGLLLMPYAAPAVAVVLGWRWILDLMGVLNYILVNVGAIKLPVPWLAQFGTAMFSLVFVNAWRGIPFFGVTLLAGLQTIPADLYEAAEVDGASAWQLFWKITLPLIGPVLLVVTVLSVIWTFNDFSVVWLLTRGGPIHATEVFSTYTYKQGFELSNLGYGQAVSVIISPLLVLVILAVSPLMLKGERD